MEPTAEQIEAVCEARFREWDGNTNSAKKVARAHAMAWFDACEQVAPRVTPVKMSSVRSIADACDIAFDEDVEVILAALENMGHLTIEDDREDKYQ